MGSEIIKQARFRQPKDLLKYFIAIKRFNEKEFS